MFKFISVLLLSIVVPSFAAEIDYLHLSPVKIKQELAGCPNKSPDIKASCVELKSFAERINNLAIQLQVDRQGFGRDILALQEKVAIQQKLLAKNKNDVKLFTELTTNQQKINERLLLIRWLESPR